MKKFVQFGLLSFMFLLAPQFAAAADFRASDSGVVVVNKNESVRNLYTAGQNIDINSYVDKDLAAAGTNINLEGNVGDDLFAAGDKIVLDGMIGGSARVAGNSIAVNNRIEEDLLAAGNNLRLSQNSIVSGDFYGAGSIINFEGLVNSDLVLVGDEITISGRVNGDVRIKNVNKLIVKKTAIINGSLHYSSPNEAEIETGATIGSIDFTKTTTGMLGRYSAGFWKIFFLKLISSLLVLLLLIYLFPSFSNRVIEDSKKNILQNIGYGILIFVMTPIVALILLIGTVTASVALVLLLLYAVYLFLAFAYAPLLLGNIIMGFLKRKEKGDMLWVTVLIGTVVALLLSLIKGVGPIFIFALMLIVLGIFAQYSVKHLRK